MVIHGIKDLDHIDLGVGPWNIFGSKQPITYSPLDLVGGVKLDDKFDIVINVESSHRYNDMEKFLQEVFRVLKPGGHFLFTDFRLEADIKKLNSQFETSGFKIKKEELITPNVLEALQLTTYDREKLIQSLAPRFLHGLGKKFAATEGTPTYNKFYNQEFEYLSHVLTKQ